jgi:hypothetical protein
MTDQPMPDLRVPSVQHLARNWRNDPALIARILVRLAMSPPRFNYNPLYAAVRDLLILNIPYDQVVKGIELIKRASVRANLLEVLPLIRNHFAGISPDFYQTIDKRYYSVGRGLMVPFEPPMIYGVSGQLYFPWFSFWRRNPLAKERLSLFVTMVDEILLDDPDLETARFEILDFSCVGPKQPRTLTVINARDIPRLSEAPKLEMLEAFAEGYFRAVASLKGEPAPAEDGRTEKAPEADPDQPGFFD